MSEIVAIRGKILCTEIEIRMPAEVARRPGWTRMEAVTEAAAELGIGIEDAQRIQVIPAGDEVIVRWMDYGAAGRFPEKRSRLATY